MQYRGSGWMMSNNYDLFWVIIGAVLFGLLFAYYIWMYFKFNGKDSESAPREKTAYNHRRVLERT